MSYEHTTHKEITQDKDMIEEWRPTLGGRFQVSNFGAIRSSITGKKLKIHLNGQGYPHVNFSIALHLLVAEAFLGPRPKSMETNHKDGIKINARLDNLEYVTQMANHLHAVRLGLKATAKNGRHGRYKIKPKEAEEIRAFYKPGVKGFGQNTIAKKFGVARSAIRQLLRGKSFK